MNHFDGIVHPFEWQSTILHHLPFKEGANVAWHLSKIQFIVIQVRVDTVVSNI